MEEVRHISFVVTTAGAGLELEVSRLSGREAISQLFEYEVLASYRQEGAGGVTAEDLIGQEAAILIYRVKDKSPEIVRRIHGMIAEVNDRLETQADFSSFRIRFMPRAYRLSLVEQQDVLLDVDLATLIRQKMQAASIKEEDYKIKLFDRYPTRELVVQYRESDLAFLARQCEHLGVSFYFEHEEGRDVLVFTDRNEVFPEIQGETAIPYRPRGEHHEIYRFEENLRMIPAQYVVRDYNYRNPQMDVTGQAMFDEGKGLVVEYGAHVKSPDEADQLAKIRAEERITSRRQFEGTCDVERIASGRRFVLSEHPMGDVRLLVTEVSLQAALSAYGAGIVENEELRFECQFKAIREATRHRPARVTPRPRIYGVISAVVEAEEKGQYAEVDDQGRYLVKFMFDTKTPDGRRASRYLRMAQPHTGAGYGMHFPLRAGIEVLISFIDGDPDRPIITAAVPNPQTASPVVKENRTRNVVRTGGGNEINIDDTEEAQRIKLHSPYASTTFQLGAPNAPESGAVLETWGAKSELAFSGASTMSTWNANLSLAKAELSSGNVISNAGSEPASTGQWILWAANLTTNSIGAMADVALKAVEVLKKKNDAKLAAAKAKKIKADAAYQEMLQRRIEEVAKTSPGKSYAELRFQVEKDVGDKTGSYRTVAAAGGTVALGSPPMTFGKALEKLSKDPNDPAAQGAVKALMDHRKELSAQIAGGGLTPEQKSAAQAELARIGTLAEVFATEKGSTDPFRMPASEAWTKKQTEYLDAAKALGALLGEAEAELGEADPAKSNNALVLLKLQSDVVAAEYARAEFEATQGEHARGLKQAELTLNAIKKGQDALSSVSAWYSTIMGILGALNESGSVDTLKEQWNDASSLLSDSKHRDNDGKLVLGKAVPSYIETVSGWGALIAILGGGIVGPAAGAAAKLALEAARSRFKKLVAPSKVITANTPEPTYNIQSSEGTAAVMGKQGAMVSGQVTVLFAQEDKSLPDPTSLLGEVKGGLKDIATKLGATLRKSKDITADIKNLLGTNTIENAGTVAVIGEKRALVASPETVEIAGTTLVNITSTQHVDVLGEEQVDVLAGPRANPGWGMTVDAPGRKVAYGNVTGQWKGEITDQEIHLGARLRKMGLESKMQATTVSHGNTSVRLDGASMTLKSTRIEQTATMVTVNGRRIMIG